MHSMRCEQCGGRTRIRFNQLYCAACENERGLASGRSAGVGFVVVDMHALRLGAKRPVFRTRTMAERWMALRGISNADVHAVSVPDTVEWRRPGGRLTGIELASRSFRVEINLAVGHRSRGCVG